jgi:hypothetical protein
VLFEIVTGFGVARGVKIAIRLAAAVRKLMTSPIPCRLDNYRVCLNSSGPALSLCFCVKYALSVARTGKSCWRIAEIAGNSTQLGPQQRFEITKGTGFSAIGTKPCSKNSRHNAMKQSVLGRVDSI